MVQLQFRVMHVFICGKKDWPPHMDAHIERSQQGPSVKLHKITEFHENKKLCGSLLKAQSRLITAN